MVKPVKATRIRAPGGSFICPKTMAVFPVTPDSFPVKIPATCPFNTGKYRTYHRVLGQYYGLILESRRSSQLRHHRRSDLPPFQIRARGPITQPVLFQEFLLVESSSKDGALWMGARSILSELIKSMYQERGPRPRFFSDRNRVDDQCPRPPRVKAIS